MTMRAFSAVIPNNDEVKVNCRGRTIYVRDASSQILVSAESRRNDQNAKALAERLPMTSRQVFYTDAGEQFDFITLRNESGGSVDVTIIAGLGDYNAPLAEVALDVPSIFDSGADVVANAAGAMLLAANASRKCAIISIDDAEINAATLAGSQADAAANLGVQMQPGMTYFIETTAELWVARDGAADVDVHVAETAYA